MSMLFPPHAAFLLSRQVCLSHGFEASWKDVPFARTQLDPRQRNRRGGPSSNLTAEYPLESLICIRLKPLMYCSGDSPPDLSREDFDSEVRVINFIQNQLSNCNRCMGLQVTLTRRDSASPNTKGGIGCLLAGFMKQETNDPLRSYTKMP